MIPLAFVEIGVGQAGGIAATAAVVAGACVGLIFRNAARAWRDERDAAEAKAERLDRQVTEQASQIRLLQQKIAHLEKLTDLSGLVDQTTAAHHEIIAEFRELQRATHANTVVLELICRQMFPTATFPAPEPA